MNINTISSSQSLNSDILFELDKIKKGSLKRRLTNELVEFAKNGSYINAEYEYDDTKSFITITIVLKEEDNVYHFDITDDYPFKPPENFRINYKLFI
jgi:ubiquitin-protein ligase